MSIFKTIIKWHWIEGLSSLLIAGLGQIFLGESKKGIIIILTIYLAVPFALYSALAISGYLFLPVLGICSILAIFLWLYSIMNALTYRD